MYRKSFIVLFAAAVIVLFGASDLLAQTGQLRGKVVMKQADGKEAPVAGAEVDVFRTDNLPGKWNIKSDKSGNFVFAAIPYVGTYALSVSAPNAEPKVVTGVKAGRDVDYKVTMNPGGGKRFTEAEAKEYAKQNAGGGATGGGESSEARAKREEIERKNAEIAVGNEKIQNVNTLYINSFKNGNASLKAAEAEYAGKRVDPAIEKFTEAINTYDEALNADPTHPGAPALLTNKASALKGRGVARYNAAMALKDEARNAALEVARSDFRGAAESSAKAVEMLKAMTKPTDPGELKNYELNKYYAFSARAESMRLFVTKVDPSKLDEGITAYEEFIAVETKPEAKLQAQLNQAQMMFDSGAADKAVVAYQKILETNPDNVEALLGAGLALYGTGDKAKFEEAATYLQRFVDKAPDTHQFKSDAKAVLESLKSEGVKPQKTTPTGRRRG